MGRCYLHLRWYFYLCRSTCQHVTILICQKIYQLLLLCHSSTIYSKYQKAFLKKLSKNCPFTLCVTKLAPFHISPFFVASGRAGFWQIFPVDFDKYSGADLTNPWGGTLCGGEVWRLPLSWSRSRPIWLLDNPAFLSDHKMIVMRKTAMIMEFKAKIEMLNCRSGL